MESGENSNLNFISRQQNAERKRRGLNVKLAASLPLRVLFCTKNIMPAVQNLLDQLDRHFPWNRVEKWDTVGLHIGDKNAEIDAVYVCYEVSDAAIEAATASGAGAIVAYHPLIFRPLASLNAADVTARLAIRVVAANMALICVHSALDGAPPPHALGDALAAQLGLHDVRVAAATGVPQLVNIVVFVPKENVGQVRAAMWEAGAGKIGMFYDQASFKGAGEGTFRPLEGSNPTVGVIDELSHVGEVRLEVLAPADQWPQIMEAVRRVHGYEEVAHNVTALLNDDVTAGYGPLRIGQVERQSLDSYVETVREKLNPPSIRVVRPDDFGEVETVACSPGSGASFIGKLPRGTTFVCADIKHHDALQARARGIALLDVTHAATETATVPLMAGALEELAGLRVVREAKPRNPFES